MNLGDILKVEPQNLLFGLERRQGTSEEIKDDS